MIPYNGYMVKHITAIKNSHTSVTERVDIVVEMASTNVLTTPTGSFGSSNIVPEVGLASNGAI